MKNLVQNGHTLSHVVTSGESSIASGEVVVVGAMIGVACTAGTYAAGDSVAVNLNGVYLLDKTTSLAITQGDRVFYNTSTKKITKTVSDNPIGFAFTTEVDAATTVQVLLDPEQNGSLAQSTVVAAITTVDGSNAGTTQTLANDTKAKVNQILAALKVAGLMASA